MTASSVDLNIARSFEHADLQVPHEQTPLLKQASQPSHENEDLRALMDASRPQSLRQHDSKLSNKQDLNPNSNSIDGRECSKPLVDIAGVISCLLLGELIRPDVAEWRLCLARLKEST